MKKWGWLLELDFNFDPTASAKTVSKYPSCCLLHDLKPTLACRNPRHGSWARYRWVCAYCRTLTHDIFFFSCRRPRKLLFDPVGSWQFWLPYSQKYIYCEKVLHLTWMLAISCKQSAVCMRIQPNRIIQASVGLGRPRKEGQGISAWSGRPPWALKRWLLLGRRERQSRLGQNLRISNNTHIERESKRSWIQYCAYRIRCYKVTANLGVLLASYR